MKITKEQLRDIILREISLAKAGDEHYHDYDDMDYEGGCGDDIEPMDGPEMLGIAVDEMPCGCPDMAHNHNNNEGSMSRSQLMHMRNYAEELMHMIQDHSDLPEWVELKITLANDYIAKVKHYLEGELAREQGMLEEKK
tara:strand:+ start:51 stop:467 length:417 start_codon:yes stop_codon:yes gene_type:complete